MPCERLMPCACDEVPHQHAEVLTRVGPEFRSGTAIHMGPTAYGAFSSQEFTLLGDAVNLVFLLKSLTRKFGERVLVSSDFLEGGEEGCENCRSLGSHVVKGRTKEVEVFVLEQAPA
jgi:class 3 adenylate cyclase